MKREGLDERLRALEPEAMSNKIPLMDMTLQGLVNLIRERVPDCQQEIYRLLRCTDANVDMHSTLAEVAYRAAMGNQEAGDRILYDVFVRPFLKLMEGEPKDE